MDALPIGGELNPSLAKPKELMMTQGILRRLMKWALWEWAIFLVVVVLAGLAALYLKRWVLFPFPLEYREAVSIELAQAMLRGINPFTVGQFPEFMYVYGLLYIFAVLPLVHLVSPMILAPRIVSAISLAVALIAFLWTLRMRGASLLESMVAALILGLAACMVLSINGARPDMAGLMFMLLGLFFVSKFHFNVLSLLACAFCGLGAFYTKQYLAFPFVFLVVYLFLFQAKRKALLYGGILLGVGVLTYLPVRLYYPLYWRYAVLHHINAYGGTQEHMLDQVWDFLAWFWAICIYYVYYLHRRYFIPDKGSNPSRHFDLANWRKPLVISLDVDLCDFLLVANALILVFLMGQEQGNNETYFLELLLPFLLMAVIPSIGFYLRRGWVRGLILAGFLTSAIPLSPIFGTPFSIYVQNYRELVDVLNHCDSIYATPLLAGYLMDRGISPIYGGPETDYGYTVVSTHGSRLLQVLVGGNDDALAKRWQDWNTAIKTRIVEGQFDCVALSNNSLANFHYHVISVAPNVAGWTVQVWVPNRGQSQ